jgi:hypothetical protein
MYELSFRLFDVVINKLYRSQTKEQFSPLVYACCYSVADWKDEMHYVCLWTFLTSLLPSSKSLLQMIVSVSAVP